MAVCRWVLAFCLLSMSADVPNVKRIDMVVPSRLVRNPFPYEFIILGLK